MEIGVRELKQHLSEYLERAARGERITVTQHGRAKAVLSPLPGGDHLWRGIAEGWIAPPTARGPLPPAPHRARATATIAEMIRQDRAE